MLWYGSRHYDPELGRFIKPDTIVPLASQGVQALDRYAYANNAPTRYTDPTGHMIDDGYVGNQRRLDCQKYGQYCNNGQPKSSAELIAMRTPPQPEPPRPWEWSRNVNIGFHIGGGGGAPMPDYYGETENSANIPYVSDFIPSNQNPMLCTGGASLGCLISLGTALIPYHYGPANTDANFFVSFNLHYGETSGMTVSDMYWSNRYSGPATFPEIRIGDESLQVIQWDYMPTDGSYRPIVGSGGQYSGNEPLSVELAIYTFVNTPQGLRPVPQFQPFSIPSLRQIQDMQR